jgi:hypothetical protein
METSVLLYPSILIASIGGGKAELWGSIAGLGHTIAAQSSMLEEHTSGGR